MTKPTDRSRMLSGLANQQEFFEKNFGQGLQRWSFHDTGNTVVRYLRDRRLWCAISNLKQILGNDLSELSALTVCGGVGGEATFLRKAGFIDITNSDFSENALSICRQRDPDLKTKWLNAESMDLEDESYDVVLVQDGLHHLPRPILGFNEMIRIARRAVIVLEPHTGLVAKLLGREWEEHEGVFNYVFRWDRRLFEQATKSQILKRPCTIRTVRLWDHSGCIHRAVHPLGNGSWSLNAARVLYACLTPFNFVGNNFIGIVVKHDAPGLENSRS